MASSSGCAINKQIRLLESRGKLRVKGEEEVEERVQKTTTAAKATTAAVQSNDAMMCKSQLSRLRVRIQVEGSVLLFSSVGAKVVAFLRARLCPPQLSLLS